MSSYITEPNIYPYDAELDLLIVALVLAVSRFFENKDPTIGEPFSHSYSIFSL